MRKTIISLVSILVSVLCLADTYEIIKLNPSPVIIGGKEKKVGSTFNDKETIEWKYDNQGMWVKDQTNKGYRFFSKDAFRQANVTTAYAYLKTNHPSTRGGSEWLLSTQKAYNGERRIALVIGNSNYEYERSLRNPIPDVTDLVESLRKTGFDVMRMYDADKESIDKALLKFRETAKTSSYTTTLFYYAGHGQQFKGQTYLVPVDANVSTEYDVRHNCVPGPRVVSFMNDIGAATNIVLIDACRSEASLLRGSADEELRMEAPENGIVVFSTKSGDVAEDGPGIHSPFAEAILQNMSVENRSINQIVMNVTKIVKEKTSVSGRVQVPNTMSSLDHDFFFRYKSSQSVPSTPTQNTPENKNEVSSKTATTSSTSNSGSSTSQTSLHITISGKVVDEEGKPVYGATIYCPKTDWTAVTYSKGDYRITVPRGETIKIYGPGYKETVLTAYTDSMPDIVLQKKESPKKNGTLTGHEWVDLGLPSGLKWATCNIGASSPELYGTGYCWGETSAGKDYYSWKTYKWSTRSGKGLTKYNPDPKNGSTIDNRKRLELMDDAAHQNWGGTWRIPTKAEFEELLANCEKEYTRQNGLWGIKFTSKKNGNSIFFPSHDATSPSFYWTSSLKMENPEDAWFFQAHREKCTISSYYRYVPLYIRPVTE